MTANIKQLSTEVKQLSDDMKGSFKQLATYQIEMEHHIDTRFAQVGARLDKMDSRLDNVETLLVQILARLPQQSE
jgi:hypothetical protein